MTLKSSDNLPIEDGKAIVSSFPGIGSNDTLLEGYQFSFASEFCFEGPQMSEDAAGRTSQYCFEQVFKGKEVELDSDVEGAEALDILSVEPSSKFIISGSNLDDENFGDPSNLDVYRHFFTLSGGPFNIANFRPHLIEATDRLTAKPLATTEHTNLVLRISVPDYDEVSPLALALNCQDQKWFDRSGRPFGRLLKEETWVKGVGKDAIAGRVIQEFPDLDKDASLEAWLEALDKTADMIVSEGEETSSWISRDKGTVEFTHIGGKGYQDDFAINIETFEEMSAAVLASVTEDGSYPINRSGMRQKLQDFIGLVLTIKDKASRIDFKNTVGSSVFPTFDIYLDDIKIGRISKFTQQFESPQAENPFDNCLVSIGQISQFTSSGEECRTIASLLHHRLLENS